MKRESVENNKSNTAKMNTIRIVLSLSLSLFFILSHAFLHISVHIYRVYDSKYSRDSSPAMIFDLVCFALVRSNVCGITHERTCLRCAFSTLRFGIVRSTIIQFSRRTKAVPFRRILQRIASLFRFRIHSTHYTTYNKYSEQ